MTDHIDPGLEPLYAKGRAQNALLLALGILVIPFALTLALGEGGYLGERKFAALAGVAILLLPLLSLRGWAGENIAGGYGICVLSALVGSFVGTGLIWVALVAALAGAGAAFAFYKIKNNLDYRPKLLPAAIEKARAATHAQPTTGEGA